MRPADQRTFDASVREVLATVCVEWYFDMQRLRWDAFTLVWGAISAQRFVATLGRSDVG